MTQEIQKGSFETTLDNFQKMVKWSSAPFDERYNQIWFNLGNDEGRMIANAGGHTLSYCTFDEPFVENVDLHPSVEGGGLEAILKADKMKDWLQFAGGNELSVEFYGVEDERGCRYMIIDGDFEVTVYLSNADSDFEAFNLGIAQLYDSEDRYVPASTFDMEEGSPDDGEPLSTHIETDADQFERIVEVSTHDLFNLSTYPVVVEDETFLLDATDNEGNNAISGELEADVDGPDVHNHYTRAFDMLFGDISGEIDVRVEDEMPIDIVKQSADNALTLRYVILPAKG